MRKTLACMLGTVVLVSAITAGCGDGGNPGSVVIPYPMPGTADQLMFNFKSAYDRMNVDEYRNALHPDFVFVFADGSPVAPDAGYFTRDEDLQSTTRMFDGEQGHDPDGLPKPGVRDIEFTEMTRLTAWEDVPEDDARFPGAVRALYDVQVVFYLDTESTSTITVGTQQMFYLKSVDEEQTDGSAEPHFYMIGQQDLDGRVSASIDTYSWSEVKALYYRPAAASPAGSRSECVGPTVEGRHTAAPAHKEHP
jgi:hypothetical protein